MAAPRKKFLIVGHSNVGVIINKENLVEADIQYKPQQSPKSTPRPVELTMSNQVSLTGLKKPTKIKQIEGDTR